MALPLEFEEIKTSDANLIPIPCNKFELFKHMTKRSPSSGKFQTVSVATLVKLNLIKFCSPYCQILGTPITVCILLGEVSAKE